MKTLSKFENIADALDNISAIAKGKVSPKLASLLQDLDDKSSSLIVSDPKLGIIPTSGWLLTCRNINQTNPRVEL